MGKISNPISHTQPTKISQSSPSYFRPSVAASDSHHHRPPSPLSATPNLNTCFYHTDLGVFSLTWSRTFLSHSLDLLPTGHPHHDGGACSPLSLTHSTAPPPPTCSAVSFHLQIKPFFFFWKKHGSKTLPEFQIFWNLSRAKFGSE
ncbi:unnamed protein product [Linum tenue]|uniref:Uncharacterized protein n=1 Tax=Linum tenue TaxID=586396 RepID=A0AAV0MD79_9ROSI|nr:unnamed protein product [Linum tenue]